MPAARGRVCQLSPDSCGFTPRPPLSLGLDDPYPFKRSLFGGGDYHVPGDFLRTGVFGLGLSVRGFSSLLAVTVFTCPQELLNVQYYSDVTLTTADDRHVGAHKIALCYNGAFDCNHCDYITTRHDYLTTHIR